MKCGKHLNLITVTEGMNKFIPVRKQHTINKRKNVHPFTSDLKKTQTVE